MNTNTAEQTNLIGKSVKDWMKCLNKQNLLSAEELDHVIENIVNLNEEPEGIMNLKMPTADSAFFVAFPWQHTPVTQGYNYWDNISTRIRNVQYKE